MHISITLILLLKTCAYHRKLMVNCETYKVEDFAWFPYRLCWKMHHQPDQVGPNSDPRKIVYAINVAIVNLSPSTINYYHDFCHCSSWFFTWAAAANSLHLSYKESARESAEKWSEVQVQVQSNVCESEKYRFEINTECKSETLGLFGLYWVELSVCIIPPIIYNLLSPWTYPIWRTT